jgi:hypothetical protein
MPSLYGTHPKQSDHDVEQRREEKMSVTSASGVLIDDLAFLTSSLPDAAFRVDLHPACSLTRARTVRLPQV